MACAEGSVRIIMKNTNTETNSEPKLAWSPNEPYIGPLKGTTVLVEPLWGSMSCWKTAYTFRPQLAVCARALEQRSKQR